MKKVVVIMVAITLSFTSIVKAQQNTIVAEKLPAGLKEQIIKELKYPKEARINMIEGEVMMKLTLTEAAQVDIIALNASNPMLGDYVRKQLAELKVDNTDVPVGKV